MKSRKEGFFTTDNEMIDKMIPKIGHAGFIVYSVIKRYMNNDTKACFPSMKLIAMKSGYGVRQVARAIKALELNGLIRVTTGRNRKSNQYFFTDKTFWGADVYILGKGIIMKCPECDMPVVRNKDSHYICPDCLMDVGQYVEDTLAYYYPDISKEDIYGMRKESHTTANYDYSDSYYERILAEGVSVVPVPDYKTKDIFIDFNEEDLKMPLINNIQSIHFKNPKEDGDMGYCPNCFVIMPDDKAVAECPWCHEDITPAALIQS